MEIRLITDRLFFFFFSISKRLFIMSAKKQEAIDLEQKAE